MSRVRSPKYPNFPLEEGIRHAQNIHEADRTYPITREDVAKHMGYSGLSGAADKSIATMMQYGLLERISKGEVRISKNAVDIIHPENETQKKVALRTAAFSPPLFMAINERFPDGEPSEQTLRSWLLREQFNDRALNPVIRSYALTYDLLRREEALESKSGVGTENTDNPANNKREGTQEEDEGKTFGGASIGDHVQWETQGSLAFPAPQRVRHVSEDGAWIFVEGSETGIPMAEVIVEPQQPEKQPIASKAPTLPLSPPSKEKLLEDSENEWMRNSLSPETSIRLLVKGDMGPKEIGKLITLLKAQRLILMDDVEEDNFE